MKRITFIITVIIFLIIINNLVRSIYSIWQKKDLVDDAKRELGYYKEENDRLESELSYVQTQEFIEKQARDKLFMTKPKENIVLGSQDEAQEGKDLSNDKKEDKPNWKKWVELFF